MRQASQKHATLIETLTGFETLRSVGAAGPIQRRWEQVIGSMARLSMRSRLLSASVINVAGLAVQLSSVGILVYGVHRIIEGDLSIGGLIACVMLAGRALAPLAQVAGLLVRFDQSMAALRSVDQIMQLPVERPPARHVYHQFTVRSAQRDALARGLADLGVGTAIHYPTILPAQPLFREPEAEAAFPVAARAAREVLSLPCFPELSDEELRTVAAAVRTALSGL